MSFSTIDKTNKSAFDYCAATFDQIKSICKPLKTLSIKHFCYLKMFPDGRYFHLSTNLEWQKYYYENVLSNSLILHGELLLKPTNTNKDLVPSLWPLQPNSLYTEKVRDYGFWGGFNFTNYTPEYSERWAFFSDRLDLDMLSFYLQYSFLLLKFLDYFRDVASNIIKTGSEDRHKLAFFENGIIYPTTKPSLTCELPVEKFLKEINLGNKDYDLNLNKGKRLSGRELECLCHIASGKATKEVARSLQISPRTVEQYVMNIKEKTGYHMRSDLVKLYQDISQFL